MNRWKSIALAARMEVPSPVASEGSFQASPGGTRVTFDHREIPEGQGVNYQQGWVDHYLVPMRAWFQKQNTVASSPD